MHTRTLKTLLAAGVIGAGGTFAVAQMDTDTDVDVRADRQELRNDREAARASAEEMAEKQKTVRGTVVSLARYLKEGRAAAEESTAAFADQGQTKALLGDDGEVYVILGTRGPASQRMGATDAWQRDRSARAGSATAGGETGMSGEAAAGREERSEPPLASTPGYEIENEAADDRSDAAARADATGEAGVYGMADPQRKGRHADKLPLGKRLELSGVVYERDDIRGIMVMNIMPAPPQVED